MLRVWMIDNKLTSWSIGCHFIQWQKNNSLHRVIGRSSFKAVFGTDPKLGLVSTILSQHLLLSVTTEEELDDLTLEVNSNGLMTPVDLQQESNEAESINADKLNDVNSNVSADELRNLAEVMGMETPQICITCQKNLCDDDQSYRCQTCSLPIHLSCTRDNGLCDLCTTAETISSNQLQSYRGMKVQAEKMLTVTKNYYQIFLLVTAC